MVRCGFLRKQTVFVGKLKDGTEVKFPLEKLEEFFEKHGDDLEPQPKPSGKRRGK
jgi:hypothetical protein